MNRKLTLAVVGSLTMVAAVYGNIGPAPVPKDRKVAEPPVRFEGIDKHPDYIFHLYYSGYFVPRTLIEVKDSNVIKLDFKTKAIIPELNYMGIKAMKRADYDKRM